jgi:cell division protein YceG involved in septum cleavage
MKNIRKHIAIFSIMLLLFAIMSIMSVAAVNGATTTTKILDKEKGHIVKIEDGGWISPVKIKKNGKYYIKYTRYISYDYSCKKEHNEHIESHDNHHTHYYTRCDNFDKHSYKKHEKLVKFILPKKYKTNTINLTSDVRKHVKKYGKISIKPHNICNHKKVHSGVYSISYRYNGKEYVKKIQIKAGKNKYIKIPKSAKIHSALRILIVRK